ncbi:hypothetical protein Clacol_007748 [Clathrus columnatus]|uniref:Tryptophan--tRNA ligase, mitochondrial n=1 Tax=Clathrus columnatus TaxID=1419009 RepID=A0AAV5ALB0_9AGAM|nr:hypothetical protein Clacol_007748 [Clathrus columnatus]
MLVFRTTKCISNSSFRGFQNKRLNSHAVIFSGIQPTGVPHLGNYLGAIKNWVDLQYTSSPKDVLIYSIVGWHALTLPQDPAQLRNAKLETAASLLALGIDPKRSILFHQDEVSEHLSLSWILTCMTPMGKLKRMTTWKSKLVTVRNANVESEVDDSMLNLGLFSYPVLQAADILAYQTTHVPVGEDQLQHLELCRDLAELFNKRHQKNQQKPFFTLPQAILTPCPRILSFRDPTQKMSKSSPNASSRITLVDSPEVIRKIIRSAVTDSTSGITYDPLNRPGISNLLTILGSFRSLRSSEELSSLASEYTGKGTANLKEDVADAIVEGWRRPRSEFERLREDKDYLVTVLEEGRQRAESISRKTLNQVKSLIGLQ